MRPGLYRALLRFYPRDFRERHGEEMVRLFVRRQEDAAAEGWLSVWRFRAGAAVDAVANGVAERFEVSRPGPEGKGPLAGLGRGEGGGGGMDSLIKDLRYAARTLVKSPGFALVAIVTIGLGIGANTAIFSVVRTVLLAPLPYEEPEELVMLWGEMRTRGVAHFPTSPPDFRDFREQVELLDDLGGVFTFAQSLTGEGDPVQITVGGVTPNFLDVLGVSPIRGRAFLPEDGTPNEPGVQQGAPGSLPNRVILSHALWQQRYGGDPGVVGSTAEVGGGTAEIVGIMPPGFELLMPPEAALASDVDLWMAMRIDYDNAPRNNVFIRPVGRIRDGASPAQVQAQVDRVASTISADDQVKATAGYHVRVDGLQEGVTVHVRPVLLALFGAVAFVLLIACANVSNLLLVRASERERELAVRAAMGGSRIRLLRQMFLESGLLAAAGALVGLGLAVGGIELLLALRPDNLPRLDDVGIDGLVLAFTVVAAAGAAFVFGLIPALQGSRVDLAHALKERGQAGSNRTRRLIRNGVAIGEVALSLVLLIGAGLMVRSFVTLNNVSPGYEPEGVLTFGLSIPFARYPEPRDRAELQLRIQERLEAIPGVEKASGAFPLPLDGQLFNGRYGGEEALTDPEAFGQAGYRSVLPGYFEAMGTRVLAGRTFTLADYNDSTNVVVVDRKLAEALWPEGYEGAVGERFLIRAVTQEPEWVEVIGVVEHQRHESLASEGMETVFITDRYVGSFGVSWALRADVAPLSLVPAVRSAVQGVDGDIPVSDVQLMEARMDEAMGDTRFALTLIGVFGVIALILASVGLYGVLSYLVRQRTAEIGVRMAFGAERAGILRLVVGQGMGLAGVGVVLGLVVAYPLTGVMESLLVGVEPTDPLTFAGISGIFALVAAVACYLPARRATRVDPVEALREE